MANSGDPSTFTFTIDAFPAYTKFNKRKKVMAALQIIDPTVAGHNYEDKTVIGHKGRNAGVDIYGEGNELTEGEEDQAKRNRVYDVSIFDEVEASSDDQGGDTNPDDGGDTDTYTAATEFVNGTTYYVADGNGGYVAADPQPTADNFDEGTYFTKD
jgi:hypothetical protein